MPRYHFDVTDAGGNILDNEGENLKSDHEARTCVRKLLVEQAPNVLRGGVDAGEIIVNVRDGTGPRFRGTLSMSVR